MRVITGKARGTLLKTLPGEELRPTAARVKEGLFSAIQFDIEGRRVLDLFAGSGQLGIEALSRGAEHAVFIDESADAVNCINANLRNTGLQASAEVRRGDYASYLFATQEVFDIVFIDPPYRNGLYDNAMELAAKKTEGVKDAVVNFMALKMNVEFEEGADAKTVMQNVLKACKKVESDCEIFF